MYLTPKTLGTTLKSNRAPDFAPGENMDLVPNVRITVYQNEAAQLGGASRSLRS